MPVHPITGKRITLAEFQALSAPEEPVEVEAPEPVEEEPVKPKRARRSRSKTEAQVMAAMGITPEMTEDTQETGE